jgi:hypothetical protein
MWVMGEPGESKRDQAVKVLREILATIPYWGDRSATLINLIVDAAKEEIRAELEEREEERRWHAMEAVIGEPGMFCSLGREFWAEYQALKAKRAAAGKGTA